MGNRLFESYPRGHFTPVYNRFAPPDFVGDLLRKSFAPSSTADHYRARALLSGPMSLSPGICVMVNSGAPAAAATPSVTYADDIDASVRIVSDYAIKVVERAVAAAGMTAAVITSTRRLSGEQAEIMYRMAKKNMAGQYALYGATGDKIIDVYKANKDKPKAEVVVFMAAKIDEFLAKGINVSRHVVTVAQYEKLNVLDIGVNSTKSAAGSSFSEAKLTAAFTKLESQGYIKKFIDETKKTNTCWHLEIVPDAKKL